MVASPGRGLERDLELLNPPLGALPSFSVKRRALGYSEGFNEMFLQSTPHVFLVEFGPVADRNEP